MNIKTTSRSSQSSIIEEAHQFNIILESREVFLHGYLDGGESDQGIEYRTANNFIKNITILNRIKWTEPIIIHQHSIGGYWSEGMMIYDAIKMCRCPVVIITHGIAASMGSIIPQAADLRITMPNCDWLIHEGNTGIHGQTIRKAKSWSEWEDRMQQKMMDIYAEVCEGGEYYKNKNKTQIENAIKKNMEKKEDWLLTSDEAVLHGFADAVFGTSGYENLEKIIKHVY